MSPREPSGQDGKPAGSPELLTLEEYAVRSGLSVRQARRRIWEQRRDRIAEVREQFKTDHKTTKERRE
jgi:hypothetical protein